VLDQKREGGEGGEGRGGKGEVPIDIIVAGYERKYDIEQGSGYILNK
jgi:hypothetical protein